MATEGLAGDTGPEAQAYQKAEVSRNLPCIVGYDEIAGNVREDAERLIQAGYKIYYDAKNGNIEAYRDRLEIIYQGRSQ